MSHGATKFHGAGSPDCSSPDPLANSPGDSIAIPSPIKGFHTSLPETRRLPSQSTPTNKGSSQVLKLQDYFINTPSPGKHAYGSSPTKATSRTENELNPWRIRVTVEAERNEDVEDERSVDGGSMGKPSVHTTTTTVPLKGLESSPPVQKRRGRPRKSESPFKRHGTPAPKKKKEEGSRKSLVDTQEDLIGRGNALDEARTPRKGRGRPKKGELLVSGTAADVLGDEDTQSLPTLKVDGGSLSNSTVTAGRRIRGRRKALSPVKIAVDPDESAQDGHYLTKDISRPALSNMELNRAQSSSTASASSAVRKHTQRQPSVPLFQDDEGCGNLPEGQLVVDQATDKITVPRPSEIKATTKQSTLRPNSNTHNVDFAPPSSQTKHFQDNKRMWIPMIGNSRDDEDNGDSDYDIRNLGNEEEIEDEEEEEEEEEKEENHDSFSKLQEFDSILESEGFSMVSISSIPSARKAFSDPASLAERDEAEDSVVDHINIDLPLQSSVREKAQLSPNELLTTISAQPNIIEVDSVFEDELVVAARGATPGSRESGLTSALSPTTSYSYPRNDQVSAHIGLNTVSPSGKSAFKQGGLPCISSNLRSKDNLSSPPEVRSSPPVRALTCNESSIHQTPSNIFSSPSLPPPLRDSSSRTNTSNKAGTQTLAHAIRTGITLQDVTNAKPKLGSPFSSPVKSSQWNTKEQSVGLFSGFGEVTKRGLKADLRLGEELARRQSEATESKEQNSSHRKHKSDVFTREFIDYPRLLTPAEEQNHVLGSMAQFTREVQYPTLATGQLLSPARSINEDDGDRMSWKLDTPVKVFETDTREEDEQDFTPDDYTVYSTVEGREAKWQREREAVSRQIAFANKSQVITIDDTEFIVDASEAVKDVTAGGLPEDLLADQIEGQDDIWQAEAHSSDPILAAHASSVLKPLRGKIPSPWRRESKIIRSDETTEELQLLWQPDEKARNVVYEGGLKPSGKERKFDSSSVVARLSPAEACDDNWRVEGSTHHDRERENREGAQEEPQQQPFTGIGKTQSLNPNKARVAEISIDVAYKDDGCLSQFDAYQGQEVDVQYRGEDDGSEAFEIFSETDQTLEDVRFSNRIDSTNEDLSIVPTIAGPLQAPTVALHTRLFSRLSTFASSFLLSKPLPETIKSTFPVAPEQVENAPGLLSPQLSIAGYWTDDNYRVLDALYKRYKTQILPSSTYVSLPPAVALLLGKHVYASGYDVELTMKEVFTVKEFMEFLRQEGLRQGGKVGWDEKFLAKAVVSLIVGEDKRRREKELRQEVES
ncbi:MAG: hypothetical protein M1827_007100 [Pycnora praestabilis]|nr:MAG: hypothetical protein M1827_007100 [Pycnora praestabilis]